MDINHLPWMVWKDWMNNLSKYRVGVQLGTAAAGTFNLNCSYLGIPCIGYSNLNTQRILHPPTTVELGDVHVLYVKNRHHEEIESASDEEYNNIYIYIYYKIYIYIYNNGESATYKTN